MADKAAVVSQVVLAATYASAVEAEADYSRLVQRRKSAALTHAHAALLVRDASGKLRIEQHSFDTVDVAGIGAVVGIVAGVALGVIFPPLGLAVASAALAGGVGGGLVGGAVGAALGHLEGSVDSADLERVGAVLRSGQAALVVAVDEPNAAELSPMLVGSPHVERIDLHAGAVDDAYAAIGRALQEPTSVAAHALAAERADVAALLQMSDRGDRAATLTPRQHEHLESIASDLEAALTQSAPTSVELAAVDKAARILENVIKGDAVTREVRDVAAAFTRADVSLQQFYQATSLDSVPPIPMPATITDMESCADQLSHVAHMSPLKDVGLLPSDRGAVTHGAHVLRIVATRLDDDLQAAVERVRDAVN